MATREYTVLYKNVVKFSGRSTDENVYTFKTAAVNEDDAFRIFKMSRLYRVTNAKGRKVSHFKRFKVVRIYTGDGIHRCTCKYCVSNPSMSPAVRVIKSKMPRWMNKSFSSK